MHMLSAALARSHANDTSEMHLEDENSVVCSSVSRGEMRERRCSEPVEISSWGKEKRKKKEKRKMVISVYNAERHKEQIRKTTAGYSCWQSAAAVPQEVNDGIKSEFQLRSQEYMNMFNFLFNGM